MGLVNFKYHMCIINQQVVGHKSATPRNYPPHWANSSWLPNQGQTLAHSKNHLTWQSQ